MIVKSLFFPNLNQSCVFAVKQQGYNEISFNPPKTSFPDEKNQNNINDRVLIVPHQGKEYRF